MDDYDSRRSSLQKEFPYFSSNYDTKERFCSYWHQIDEAISLKPKSILEIGIGNGFVSNYLKSRRVQLITLDIKKKLVPNIVGSVLEICCKDSVFDLVMCCEVLEHLPYDDFSRALKEIRRVSKSYSVVSVPDVTTAYPLYIGIPRLGKIKKLISHPFPKYDDHHFDGEHYWLIGKTGYPLKRIKSDIENSGFHILKTYRVFEWYYHRFFILKKR